MIKPLQAGPRDATACSSHGRGGKFHALYDGGDDGMRAMCDRNIVINEDRIEPAQGLTDSEKCNRGGCRVAFRRGY